MGSSPALTTTNLTLSPSSNPLLITNHWSTSSTGHAGTTHNNSAQTRHQPHIITPRAQGHISLNDKSVAKARGVSSVHASHCPTYDNSPPPVVGSLLRSSSATSTQPWLAHRGDQDCAG